MERSNGITLIIVIWPISVSGTVDLGRFQGVGRDAIFGHRSQSPHRSATLRRTAPHRANTTLFIFHKARDAPRRADNKRYIRGDKRATDWAHCLTPSIVLRSVDHSADNFHNSCCHDFHFFASSPPYERWFTVQKEAISRKTLMRSLRRYLKSRDSYKPFPNS